MENGIIFRKGNADNLHTVCRMFGFLG